MAILQTDTLKVLLVTINHTLGMVASEEDRTASSDVAIQLVIAGDALRTARRAMLKAIDECSMTDDVEEWFEHGDTSLEELYRRYEAAETIARRATADLRFDRSEDAHALAREFRLKAKEAYARCLAVCED